MNKVGWDMISNRTSTNNGDLAKLARLVTRAEQIKKDGGYGVLPAFFNQYLRSYEGQLKSREFVSYVRGPKIGQFDYDVLLITNEERVKNKLKPFTLDMKLSNVALEKSKDMYTKKYFNHQSPTYGSPFDMMKKFGITYHYAGENIAQGYNNPKAVVNGWMNSPGHRANILNANFSRLGTGYHQQLWTQMFTG
ncbi:hypothetical protein GJU40_08330 [Bacillus lacus]|uniref:SCP domain-containing protein n=2 Tax=Metabacillus lacus TaxID=1983721 RepID=A0A7X2LYA4_9BACI|nr:hypothetical protein [Metabacillus lacus]